MTDDEATERRQLVQRITSALSDMDLAQLQRLARELAAESMGEDDELPEPKDEEERSVLLDAAKKNSERSERAVRKYSEGGEVAKIGAHFERFSEHFPRDFKKADLVAGFKAARKHDKTLTADEFLRR